MQRIMGKDKDVDTDSLLVPHARKVLHNKMKQSQPKSGLTLIQRQGVDRITETLNTIIALR